MMLMLYNTVKKHTTLMLMLYHTVCICNIVTYFKGSQCSNISMLSDRTQSDMVRQGCGNGISS